MYRVFAVTCLRYSIWFLGDDDDTKSLWQDVLQLHSEKTTSCRPTVDGRHCTGGALVQLLICMHVRPSNGNSMPGFELFYSAHCYLIGRTPKRSTNDKIQAYITFIYIHTLVCRYYRQVSNIHMVPLNGMYTGAAKLYQ